MDDLVGVAPVNGLTELVDVAAGLLNGNAVRHLLQQLQHVLGSGKWATLTSYREIEGSIWGWEYSCCNTSLLSKYENYYITIA